MPVIPVVGRRSFRTRLLIAAIYLVLSLGAVTMIYPFALMLATATTGNADWREFRLVPRYFLSRADRFRKYVLDKNRIEVIAYEYGHEDWFVPADVRAEQFDDLLQTPPAVLDAIDRDYADFTAGLENDLKGLHFVVFAELTHSVLSLRNEYFDFLAGKYGHDIAAVNRLYEDTALTFDELGLPSAALGAWELNPESPRFRDWREFVLSRPYARQDLVPLDRLSFAALRLAYGTVNVLNRIHGTNFRSFRELRWDVLGRTDWGRKIQDAVLRQDIPLAQLRLSDAARAAFDAFAREADPEHPVPFTARAPADRTARAVWVRFVRSDACPLKYFDPIDPQTIWQQFLRGRYRSVGALNTVHGADYKDFTDALLPARFIDCREFSRHERSILRQYLVGNFSMVIGYVLLHGRALVNTVIFIVLTILATLTVNPMAAYVLSRFRLRYAHHILIFLLATMAFPAEVVMIPSFLLVKSFPLGAILLGAAALALFLTVRLLLRWRLPLFWSLALGSAAALAGGYYLPPLIAAALGRADLNVSLMNTFFALVLPGIASGYSIFLLKGFFDSLPPELYEAGMLDGASETRMFFAITIPLCKPVLAVIALQAFTIAYGAFMFAFLTCQDPKMWTLMVFLYQFQQTYSVPLVMASLVIAAVPTLIVFILCQNVILRGIVIPTFK